MNSQNLSVSVVIPNYNGYELLARNLPKVILACPQAEIIVVDDASTDQSALLLKTQFPKVKIVQLKQNVRFAAASNEGVKAAHNDIILLLNNDVEPTPKFLNPLLSHFNDESIFAVGCAEVDPGNPSQISGRSTGVFKRGFLVHSRAHNQTPTTTLWVSGGSAAFNRKIWLKLGGLDPLFAPAYQEDRDVCYRALKRGYTIKFAKDALVYHRHEKTNIKELGQTRMTLASYKNSLLFVWKNITGRRLLASHILWLPYHLIFTTYRSKGLFFLSFIWALTYIPRLLPLRQLEKRHMVISDETILARHQS